MLLKKNLETADNTYRGLILKCPKFPDNTENIRKRCKRRAQKDKSV